MIRAVKIQYKNKMNQNQKDWLNNEVNIMKELDHPNIQCLYEFYEDEKRYYIVTECCIGGDLYDEIGRIQVFPEKNVA